MPQWKSDCCMISIVQEAQIFRSTDSDFQKAKAVHVLEWYNFVQ